MYRNERTSDGMVYEPSVVAVGFCGRPIAFARESRPNRRSSDSSEGGKTENRRAVTEKCATREPMGKHPLTSAIPLGRRHPLSLPVERFDSRLRLIARASRREIHHVGRSRSVTDRLRASARVSEEAVLGVIFLWRER